MPVESERRYVAVECRAEGRTLSGIAVRYDDEARLPWGVVERIQSGAFGALDGSDVMLNEMHDRSRPLARTGGGGLTLASDSNELRVTAVLPSTRACDDVLTLVRSRVYRGLSIEFVPDTERMIDDVRVIESARLLAVAVVDTPAYPLSYVKAMRSRSGASRASVEARRRVWL